MWNGHIKLFWPTNINLILATLVAAVIGIAANRINCSHFVRELPQTIPKIVLMKESPVISNNRIFIVNKEEIDLYVPQSSRRLAGCSEQIVPLTPSWPIWPNKKPGLLVDSKCSSKHLPLSARTRTMDDLREDDVSIRKRLTEVRLKRYEEKERIRNRIDN